MTATSAERPPCGAPGCPADAASGATLCREHQRKLRAALAQVPGILIDLRTTISRQDKISGSAGRAAEDPVPFNERAALTDAGLRRQLITTAMATARRYADERDPLWASASQSAAEISRWLMRNLATLGQLPDAGEHLRQLDSAVYRARQATDRPQVRTRFPVGPCPRVRPPEEPEPGQCRGEVWAIVPDDENDPAWLRCLTCSARWDTTQWRRVARQILRRMAELDPAFYPEGRDGPAQ